MFVCYSIVAIINFIILINLFSVVFAYEQCLLCLGHHPDIWYEYASYLDENSKLMAEKGDMSHHKNLQEDVATVYERATTTLLKENVLLHFSYADFEEVWTFLSV